MLYLFCFVALDRFGLKYDVHDLNEKSRFKYIQP